MDRYPPHNFIQRYHYNSDRTDKGHFSIINQLYVELYGKFENLGYQIPDKAFNGVDIRPDNSVGKLFSNYLKIHHPNYADDFKEYSHLFPNGKEFPARQYKNTVWHLFIEFFEECWLHKYAYNYFKKRDPLALDYLEKLLER